MTLQVCWFRNDLRIDDNPALHYALTTGPVVGIYIATPDQWQTHADAPVKIDFWRRNLICLEQSLAKLNIPMLYFQVGTYNQIPKLLGEVCSRLNAQALYFNREYPVNEVHRDNAVSKLLADQGVEVHGWHEQTLLAPGAILTGSDQPFKVFTPFSKKAITYLEHVACLPAPETSQQAINKALLTGLPEQTVLADIPWPDVPEKLQKYWPAGEEAARQKLNEFCKNKLDTYKDHRDFPAIRGTSRLSAWLTSGIISIRRCWLAAENLSDSQGAFTWKKELLWRDFYKHIVHHYPHVCMHQPWRQDARRIPWREDQGQFERWCQGETGFPLIDAAMKQLLATGWMHNRLRMVTAMFLSKQLLIDWRKGEQWFMQHLVDGDMAANNGGWQWSSSTGTDAAPYFRIFNPVTQSERFDADGTFIKHYLPQLKHLNGKQLHLPGDDAPEGYCGPMVDHKEVRERALKAFKSVY